MPATNELLQEGRYRISHPVSGDGNVFEAYDTVRNTTVFVREFPVKLNKVTTLSQQESMRIAFANQAKALSEIEHESLLHVHDYFSEIDRQYLVMESIEGEDLSELLRRNKKGFSVGEVVVWADELLDALNYLHSLKPAIIHRNISPLNLRRDASGKVKLLGVGVDSGPDTDAHPDGANLRYSPMEQIWPGLDAASQKVITNSYDDRSERILKEPLDARSDIYSLGATLYFLMTGIEPVDPLERSIDILEGKLDPLREPTKVDSEIPAEISDVLMKSLEIKRENRYDSAMIMRQVLKTAISRVEEREAEEALEQSEAAEIIRLAAQAKSERPPAPEVDHVALAAEQRRREDAEKQRRQEELLQQQLREAEQQRILAEQAAEAERALREKEEADARLAAEKLAAVPEENLLEIPVSAEVVAYRDNTVDENELAAVLEELEKAELESLAAEQSEPPAAPAAMAEATDEVEAEAEAEEIDDEEGVQVFERTLDETPDTAADVSSDGELFAQPEKRGFSLPLPAIAGAVGFVIVAAIGGWVAMSGSSEPARPQPATEIQVAQPAPQESNPAAEVITSTQAQTDANTTAAATEQQAASPKAAPAAKPKKADKPQPEKKKAVTADDLINDN